MVGRNINKWFEEFITGPADLRIAAASRLVRISEFYFEDHKVSREERKSLLNKLTKLLPLTDPLVRKCMASLVGNLQLWTPEAESILSHLLSDKSDQVLATAIWATGNLKSNAIGLVPKLLQFKDHNSRELRASLAYALKEIGLDTENVVSTLLKLVDDPDWLVRMNALEALSVCIPMPNKYVEKVIIRSLDDRDQSVQAGACRAIGTLNLTSKAAKNKLSKMAPVMTDALWALSKNWPELFYEERFRKLLEANSGYPWADRLLANKKPVENVKKSWISKLYKM